MTSGSQGASWPLGLTALISGSEGAGERGGGGGGSEEVVQPSELTAIPTLMSCIAMPATAISVCVFAWCILTACHLDLSVLCGTPVI